MRKILLVLSLVLTGFYGFANHITGGEMYYVLTSQSGNSYTYRITLKLYRDCNSNGAALDDNAAIAIFDNQSNAEAQRFTVPRQRIATLQIGTPDPCISNPPQVCYQVGYYEFTATLTSNITGYTVAYQRCCRIAGINNIIGSNAVGATYTAQIPGTGAITSAPANNSARFIGADTVIICANNSFCYNFGAFDPDGDSLAYYFCSAFTGGTSGNPAPSPPANPPYIPIPYAAPYSASSPLGDGVNIDTRNGLVCGIAPQPGIYVVTVCVSEYRNKILIATQRKDLQIKVGDCNLVKAVLPSSYPVCDDFTKTFENLTPFNSLIHTYSWSFGDGGSSSGANPTHTYADTGTYNIKLVINRGEACSDSATTKALVYPGFFPGFTVAGICVNKPTSFFDTTKTVYGFVNSWNWNFGDDNAANDTSRLQNPQYIYNVVGTKNVRLIVTSSKGCIDTLTKPVAIVDKPPLQILPKDTLICNGDNVQLHGIGNGTFTWTPNINIINANTPDPTVSPTTTTTYTATLNDNGCINTETARVRVVNFVTLQAMADTVICATDSVRLNALTDGLRFLWTPSATISDPTKLSPMALPVTTTTYQIRATIGSCTATDDVQVTLVPYPGSDAGKDTTICFRSTAQLQGTINGSSFSWSPASTLNNPNILNPVATPVGTTRYVLTVRDVLGCPKPRHDTVLVTVLPRILPFAGRDTSVVVGQPLQLNGSGGVTYTWSPGTGLNNPNISNPIGLYDGSFDSVVYKLVVRNSAGCADSTDVTVKVFRTSAQVFVPTAFTPNGDGLNDYFRPIGVGIARFEYFRVFNRWGQLVFNTTINEQGWDGRMGGKEQSSNTFVWVVKGIDYTGKVFFAKGTVALIR